jgi:hypothetical protein
VLRVRRSGPRLALRRPWSGAQAAIQPTLGLPFEGRLLAGQRVLVPIGLANAASLKPDGAPDRSREISA